ncbi:MAG: 30S ribosomal protein S16, partial [Bacteroidales bacterium]|nr:30S ribosomal protein S16 [Bacteroidales bacterium]
MPAKIRLQRKGKKGQPFYHIVIADGRAPRDGKMIEKIGTYNPLTHPADIKLEFGRALHWVSVGAQPSDTVRSILKHKGVFYKYHLLEGVKKGAFDETQAEAKFQAWLSEKEEKIE